MGSPHEAKLLGCSRGTEVVVTLRMGTPAAPRLCPGSRVGGSFSGFVLGALVGVLSVCFDFSIIVVVLGEFWCFLLLFLFKADSRWVLQWQL